MAQLTIRLLDRLKKQMGRLKEINWSEVVRKAIEARIVLEMSRRRRDRYYAKFPQGPRRQAGKDSALSRSQDAVAGDFGLKFRLESIRARSC